MGKFRLQNSAGKLTSPLVFSQASQAAHAAVPTKSCHKVTTAAASQGQPGLHLGQKSQPPSALDRSFVSSKSKKQNPKLNIHTLVNIKNSSIK